MPNSPGGNNINNVIRNLRRIPNGLITRAQKQKYMIAVQPEINRLLHIQRLARHSGRVNRPNSPNANRRGTTHSGSIGTAQWVMFNTARPQSNNLLEIVRRAHHIRHRIPSHKLPQVKQLAEKLMVLSRRTQHRQKRTLSR